MKKILILITIIFLMSFSSTIDVGNPYIQAVCKIKTKNGDLYEGFVLLINGGYTGMTPNGFYLYQNDNYNWISLFDLKFNSLKKIGDTKYKMGLFSPDAKQIYFIAQTTFDSYSHKESIEIDKDPIEKYLTRKKPYKNIKFLILFLYLKILIRVIS